MKRSWARGSKGRLGPTTAVQEDGRVRLARCQVRLGLLQPTRRGRQRADGMVLRRGAERLERRIDTSSPPANRRGEASGVANGPKIARNGKKGAPHHHHRIRACQFLTGFAWLGSPATLVQTRSAAEISPSMLQCKPSSNVLQSARRACSELGRPGRVVAACRVDRSTGAGGLRDDVEPGV